MEQFRPAKIPWAFPRGHAGCSLYHTFVGGARLAFRAAGLYWELHAKGERKSTMAELI